MTFRSLAGIALIVLGAVFLVRPDLTYTKASHDAKLGALELTLKEKDTVRIPVWVGLLAIAGGTALLWRRKG